MKTITATLFRNKKESVYNLVNAHHPVKILNKDRHDIILIDANDYLDMQAELDKFKWISVDDRLPEDDPSVLCINSVGGISIAKKIALGKELRMTNMDYDDCLCASISSGWSVDVTHWMPLPSAPINN
jgi:hypothetical protein